MHDEVVLDGRQVAVLVPTTILAGLAEASQTASRTRLRRLSAEYFVTPGNVEGERSAQTGIDIVVGTHGLLHKSVEIPDLGLLILDEEHRFGVKDKERLKRLRANLDVLSMTATPIPRTLHMSISGLRSMSVIATPPRDRLSVYTRMVRVSETITREAITYELRRGVRSSSCIIASRRSRHGVRLNSIPPELSIGVAHGR